MLSKKERCCLQASWVAADGRVVRRPRCIEIYDGGGGGGGDGECKNG
jgi:hypothetical protein